MGVQIVEFSKPVVVENKVDFVLNHDNYYSLEADRAYMSVSQFKAFCECEAKQMAKLNEVWKDDDNEAFLVGSYVHSWCEGPEAFEEFVEKNNAKIFKKGGKDKYATFTQADKMIRVLANDLLVTRVREGQKEVIMTAELFGVKWKCMIDIYNPERKVIVDLKTTREIHKKYWDDVSRTHQNFIQYYNYLLQMAVYAEIDRINRGTDDYFMPHIIAVSKEDYPDKAVINLGTDYIQEKLLEVEVKLDHIMKVKNGLEEPERCGHCDYCKSTKMLNEVVHYLDI